MIREEIPRFVMTGITFVLSIIVTLVLIDLVYGIVRVQRGGWAALIAVFSIIPIGGAEFVFALGLFRRYDRHHLSGVLPFRFAMVSAVQFLIWAAIRGARALFFRGATTSRPLTDEQLTALLGAEYFPITIFLVGLSVAFVVVAVVFARRGPRDPYGSAKDASQMG